MLTYMSKVVKKKTIDQMFNLNVEVLLLHLMSQLEFVEGAIMKEHVDLLTFKERILL